MKLMTYPDAEMMMIDLAHVLAGELNSFLAHDAQVTLAVPGGATPGPLFDDLSAARLDWARVRVLPTDERLVPVDDPRSNEGMLRRRLLTGPAAEARLIGLRPGADGMAGLADRVGRALPVSILVLGMGADMHTASLFPDAPELAVAMAPDAPPVLEITPPGQPEGRITLTAPVLKRAVTTHILIRGADKRMALDRAVALDDPMQAPICAVLKDATVHWSE